MKPNRWRLGWRIFCDVAPLRGFGRGRIRRWWSRNRAPAPPVVPMPPVGPVLVRPPGSKAAKGRPSLVIEHGTWRCPNSLTEWAEVEDRMEWRSLAFWRRQLPGVALRVTRHPIGTWDAAGIRTRSTVGYLSATDEPPAEAPPMPSTVRVRFWSGVVADVAISPDGTAYELSPSQALNLRRVAQGGR